MNLTVTLEDILNSRDTRALEERRLLDLYPDKTLILLTVIIPGNIKRNKDSEIIAKSGVNLIVDHYGQKILYKEVKDLFTGFEAFFIVDSSERVEIKKDVIGIEDNSPLGRFMDIDVFHPDGSPISRKEIGFAERKCFLCNNEARACMREKKHDYKDILDFISKKVSDYIRRI